MQLLASYHQIVLNKMGPSVTYQPPTDFEVYLGRFLIAGMILLMWWCVMED